MVNSESGEVDYLTFENGINMEILDFKGKWRNKHYQWSCPKIKIRKKKQYISLVILQIEKENIMAFNHLFPYI